MKKKLIFQLLLLSTLSVFLHSCRTDEMLTTTEQTQKEKISFFERFEKEKSLSKNTESANYALPFSQSVLGYFKNHPEKKTELESKYGVIDLKVSSQTIGAEAGDERKLIFFPMLKEGKVMAVIAGVVNAERDYLYFDVHTNTHADVYYLIDKFQQYYDSRSASKGAVTEIPEIIIVVTRPIKLTYYDGWGGNGGTGNGGHDMGGGNGDYTDGGSGGSSGTPNTATNNPCEKMKDEKNKPKFQEKASALDKPDVFKLKVETGFSVAYGQPTSNYDPLANNKLGNMILPDGNKYYGFMHTHIDKTGVVKIFSPADIFTFLTSCVRNAQDKGSMTDAFGMVITSQGNYILKYSGDGSYGLGPNQLDTWKSEYQTVFSSLTDDQRLDPVAIEKAFTQFLENTVKVSGLEVYKSDKTTGATTKLKYDKTTDTVVPTPC